MREPGQPEVSDYELLVRARAGCRESFSELYQRRQGAIFRFALQMSGSRAAAEEVVQEVFLALLRDRTGYAPERGSLLSYLYGMARNWTLRVLRENQSERPDAGEEDRTGGSTGFDVVAHLSLEQDLEELRKAILRLPARYREVVVLCELHEMSYSDAAEALGTAVGTVRSRLHRARALLAEKMKPRVARAAGRVLR
jgi:RNA polymerase sigma-70 factor, ECF subfamily